MVVQYISLVHAHFTADFRLSTGQINELEDTEERELCKVYIEECRQIRGDSQPVTEGDVDIAYALTKPFRMVSYMYMYMYMYIW